ncbi:MAG: putative cell surface glycoprotein, partial [Candidatus Curtissbacteria bacterium GW2011_GWD1_40_8]
MRREEDLNPLNPGPSEVEAAELNSGNFRDSRFGNLVTSGIFRGGGAVILGAGAAIGGAQLLQEALQNTPAPVHRGVNVAHAEDRESQPTKSPHTATPVPSDTPEATATNEPQPTPRDHTPTPVGETPTVSPTPRPSETPPPTPSTTATKEAPSPTATETEVPPSATATEKPATATATPPASPTPEEEEGQVQLLVKKRIDDGDGIFDDGDEPWIQ